MEGLQGELRRLGLKGGKMNADMSAYHAPEPERIEDPKRQAQLAQIARAYTAGQLTMEQAAQLVSRV